MMAMAKAMAMAMEMEMEMAMVTGMALALMKAAVAEEVWRSGMALVFVEQRLSPHPDVALQLKLSRRSRIHFHKHLVYPSRFRQADPRSVEQLWWLHSAPVYCRLPSNLQCLRRKRP